MKGIRPTKEQRIEARKQRISKIKSVVPPVATRFKKPSLRKQTEEALQKVPRITNDTVAEHREEVLKGARRFKYPLQHSKHKIVIVSSALLVIAAAIFLIGTVISLYRVQSTSNFVYRITQILPFPIARVDSQFVSYENYLFELRRYMHYYRTQQQVDFTSETGQMQLASYKPRVMQKVIDDVLVKKLAKKHNITVSDAEIRESMELLRIQNRLSSDDELESVIRRFYGWSMDDFKRELRQELLAQKVAATLDTETKNRADSVLQRLQAGEDFATVAKEVSDDAATKERGGEYTDSALSTGSQGVSPLVTRQLSKMQPGQISEILRTPTSYEIVKLIESTGQDKYKAAHIELKFNPVGTYVVEEAKNYTVKHYINVPAPVTNEAIEQTPSPEQ